MSIVKMKRIRLIGLMSDRDKLLHDLMLDGCVEISDLPVEGENLPAAPTPDGTRLTELRIEQQGMVLALGILDQYAHQKTGLFPPKPEVSADVLFADDVLTQGHEAAEQILDLERRIARLHVINSHLETDLQSLDMWRSLEVPLGLKGTGETRTFFGTLPGTASDSEFEAAMSEAAPLSYVSWAGESKEQKCMLLICHKSAEGPSLEILRQFGGSQLSFNEYSATADSEYSSIQEKMNTTAEEIAGLETQIVKLAETRSKLKLAADRLTAEIDREEAKALLLVSGSVFAMQGWVPVPDMEKVEKGLGTFTCAWELSEPQEEDDIPVKLNNNPVTNPMNMVTEMYSLPVYNGIDPNGLIMPFFVVFFGIMYADLGYGLVLIAISLFAKKKWTMTRTVGQMMSLMLQVGISTAVFGFLLGGFFGDAIPVFSESYLSKRVNLWAIIDPLSEPMTIMIFSLVLGAVQIIVGMIVKAYLCFRDGHPLDALFDVGSWWLVFIGIAVLVMGYGPWVLLAGVLALLLTQGRSAPTFIGKIIGGIASLYDITGYLSDILSYIRLMALLLATSVIASVVNLLATMPGNVIVFFIIFIIGHAFNMGINIVGTFVHSARLQYLEFFTKFYEEGGRPFSPLKINTKYYDVIK